MRLSVYLTGELAHTWRVQRQIVRGKALPVCVVCPSVGGVRCLSGRLPFGCLGGREPAFSIKVTFVVPGWSTVHDLTVRSVPGTPVTFPVDQTE